MIIQLLLSVIVGVIKSLVSLLPQIPVPGWLTSAAGAVSGVLSAAAQFSYWLPLQLAVTVGASVLAVMAAGFAIRIGRMIISIFTGGGGS